MTITFVAMETTKKLPKKQKRMLETHKEFSVTVVVMTN